MDPAKNVSGALQSKHHVEKDMIKLKNMQSAKKISADILSTL